MDEADMECISETDHEIDKTVIHVSGDSEGESMADDLHPHLDSGTAMSDSLGEADTSMNNPSTKLPVNQDPSNKQGGAVTPAPNTTQHLNSSAPEFFPISLSPEPNTSLTGPPAGGGGNVNGGGQA